MTDSWRDPRYDTARVRIARAAFSPSGVWRDTAMRTTVHGPERVLAVRGEFSGGRYERAAADALPMQPIAKPADSHHVIRLSRLSGNEFAWDTDVRFAIGSATPAGIAALLPSLLASGEGGEAALRAEQRVAIPRTTEEFGRLFRLDSLLTTEFADGSTLAVFAITMTPSGIEERFPKFAAYLRRYAEKARMHWTIMDRSGVAYLHWSLENGRIGIRVRSRDGELVSLSGPRRTMPDSLELRGDMTLKVHLFTVGFRDYRADFIVERLPRERAFSIVTRHEPHWVLPLIAERLLSAPLARPFEGAGTLLRLGVARDSADSQTVLTRRMHLEVRESAILRFIGRLGWLAVSEYDDEVEAQGDQWLREALNALTADIAAGG